ncbi:MAG: NlpC/P60 family protein [Lachnospiraceae bacterium]
MAMMVREKRLALVAKMESREGKNTYTQSTRRSRVDSGYSDCSSLVHWVYKEVLGINIGDDTVGQIRTKKLTTIDAGIRDGILDEKKLLPGDLLFFRGSDTGRKAADYVGHVEMYVGNGELSGHGFGIGPVRKNMAEYCRARRERSAPAPINNRGLICVRRALPADTSDYAASSASPGRKSFSALRKEKLLPRLRKKELLPECLGK